MTEAKALYDKATKLWPDREKEFLELGRILRDLSQIDHAMFNKFVSFTGSGKRSVYCFIEIDEVFRKMAGPKQRLTDIGWSKLHVIAKKVTSGNLSKMLQMAETHTKRQLEMVLGGGKASGAKKSVLFTYSDAEYEELASALLGHGAASAPRGLHNKEQALLNLIRDRKKR